jgi:hypothetical protein
MRLLFPLLPPELRNEVYSYTSAADQSPATTAGLPVTLKKYRMKHAKVEICPVHYGNPSLLALQKYAFLEGAEYHDWLMRNGVQFHIGIVFDGLVESFVQEHWDDKISVSMRKLTKKYPWIAKAARWDVRVVWAANVDSMRGRPRKSATIVNGILATILGFQDAAVRAKRGYVSVRFHIPHCLVAAKLAYGLEFGLQSFLETAAAHGVKREIREVTTGPSIKRKDSKIVGRLHTVPTSPPEKTAIMISKHGVEWSEESQGDLVMRKVVNGQDFYLEVLRSDGKVSDGSTNWQLASLRCECGDLQDTRVLDLVPISVKMH